MTGFNASNALNTLQHINQGIREGAPLILEGTKLGYMTIITNASNTIIDLTELQFSHLYWVFLLPAICAAADIITGWIQATINSCWDSTRCVKAFTAKVARC